MNYYERHLGDYAKRTTTLTMGQHGAYTLLLDYYYVTEQAIPEHEVYSVARAFTKPERDAVDRVLEKYFELADGAWRHEHCEEVIAAYVAAEPKREAKRKNTNARVDRYRERRAKLFASLRAVGIVPAYDTTTKALDALVSRHLSRVTASPVTPPVTRNVTASIPTPHSHSPVRAKTSESDSESGPPIKPHTGAHAASYAGARGRAGGGDCGSVETDNTQTLIAAGLNPSRVTAYLAAWARDGFTTERLLAAIAIAKDRKQADTVPAKYLDAVVRDESNFRHLAHGNGANGNGKHRDTAEQLEDRIIEDAIRRGLTDAEIVRIEDLQVAPDLHVRIDAKRQEVSRAEH